MENHDHNGHGESHDDNATEGNRQYYPKGWWMPLAGLVIVALGFTVIGYFAFNISGTDKWGQREETEIHDAVHGDDDAEGHSHDHGSKGHESSGHTNNNGADVKESEGLMAPIDSVKQDSMEAKPAAEGHH